MSLCQECKKDSKEHSKTEWKQHQESMSKSSQEICLLCQKTNAEHSNMLWRMHQSAISEGAKGKKLIEMTLGVGRKTGAIIKEWNVTRQDEQYRIELIPIYSYCRECGLAVGSNEEDNADVLDGLCFSCFRDVTGQEEV